MISKWAQNVFLKVLAYIGRYENIIEISFYKFKIFIDLIIIMIEIRG